MVADLQDIALQVISGGEEAILGLEAGIAREQEGDLVVGDFQDYRILIEVPCKERCWRGEDLDLEAGVEVDDLAPLGGAVGYSLLINQRQEVLEGRSGVHLAAVQNLPHREVIEDG